MKHYNILSLDGGGIRGLILLKQLVEFEKLVGEPLHEYFDMMSGTSTGGIVATMLSIGYTAEELLAIYIDHGGKIFNKKFLRFGIFRPKYNDSYFNKIIKEYVDDKTLLDTKCDLLIPAYNATLNNKILFKTTSAKFNKAYNYSLFDVVRTTASAPSFFKPWKLNDYYYIDGGLVINNPSLVSWIDGIKYEIKDNDAINVISFSTGSIDQPINTRIARGGMLSWAKPTVDILLAEQAQTTDYFLNKIYNLQKGTYVRCESQIKRSNGKIDDASKKNIENMLFDGKLSYNLNKIKMVEFINNTRT